MGATQTRVVVVAFVLSLSVVAGAPHGAASAPAPSARSASMEATASTGPGDSKASTAASFSDTTADSSVASPCLTASSTGSLAYSETATTDGYEIVLDSEGAGQASATTVFEPDNTYGCTSGANSMNSYTVTLTTDVPTTIDVSGSLSATTDCASCDAFASVVVLNSSNTAVLTKSAVEGGGPADAAASVPVPAGSYKVQITTSVTVSVESPVSAGGQPEAGSNSGSGSASADDIEVVFAPTTPSVSIGDAKVKEGNRDTKPMVFPLTLSSAPSAPVTVHVDTVDGSAKAPKDYVAFSDTVTFDAGQTTADATVLINGDRRSERTEKFSVILSDPSGVTVGDGLATGKIVDND